MLIFLATKLLAAAAPGTGVGPIPPAGGGSGITNPAINAAIGTLGSQGDAAGKFAGFIALILRLGLIIAAVMSLLYLLWGGLDWVVSGGDKTSVENARNKIIHAIIGLAIVALLVAIIQFVGGFLQINLLNLTIPTASDIP
ncbi:MAG: hypothetical protein M1120_02380 [Patescibacteria group bacterium]|nr:hypothetical protein [Patescibacteria group bacterium]